MLALTRARAGRAVALFCFSTLLACSSETRVDLLEPVQSGIDASTHDADTADVADARDAEQQDAATATSHLIHRYSFDGARPSTRVIDSVGSANGDLRGGATVDGSGHAILDGIDDYANLPNGLLSPLTSATLVSWLSWTGTMDKCWQRIFDFGSSDAGEDLAGAATTTFFATVFRCGGTGPAADYENNPNSWGAVDSDVGFPQLQPVSVAVVFDWTAGEMRLYVGGVQLTPVFNGEERLLRPLSMLPDVNDWLGRSQFQNDPYLAAVYDEFRIYDSALTTAQIVAVDQAGPDTIGP